MADVFLSYARAEYAAAEIIYKLLTDLGLSVFFDVEGLDGGDVFPDVLDREVKSAGAVLGLWTPHSLSRPWIKIECNIGKDRGVLVPVAIAPIHPLHDVPAAFYGVQHIDLINFDGDSTNQAWHNVVRSLARTLKRPDLLRREAQLHPQSSDDSERLRQEMAELRAELEVLRSRPTPPSQTQQELPKARPVSGVSGQPSRGPNEPRSLEEAYADRAAGQSKDEVRRVAARQLATSGTIAAVFVVILLVWAIWPK